MRLLFLLPVCVVGLAAQSPVAEWKLSPAPLLRLGGEEGVGPTEFANPYAAAFLSDRLVVLDGQSQVLRVFQLADGAFLRSIGRKGNGPGEFQNAAYLQALPADSLFVADIKLGRYVIFDPAGYETRTVSFASLGGKGRLTPLGRFDDGSVLAWSPRFDLIAQPGIQALSATLYRVPADGTSDDSLRTLPFAKVNSASFQKGWGFRALLGGGQMTQAVAGMTATLSSPTTYTLYRFSPQTGWRDVHEERPIRLGTGADGERLRAAAVADGASANYMATVPVVDTLPAIHYLVGAASGRLYVVEGARATADTPFRVTIYSPTGKAAGRFALSPALTLLAATDSLVALTERAPSTAPTISVYRLLPP